MLNRNPKPATSAAMAPSFQARKPMWYVMAAIQQGGSKVNPMGIERFGFKPN